MRIIFKWLIYTLAVGIAGYMLPGVYLSGLGAALLTAVILSTVNMFIRPVLIFLTLPITILTLGLFALAINAGMVIFVAKIVPGFYVSGFWPALLFSIVAAILNSVPNSLNKENNKT